MARTKKRVYRRKSRKNKRRTKRMKLKIKNLGKKPRSYKRIQYGCSSKKNMKGGGPVFQPLTDFARSSQASTQDFFNKFHGDDPKTNEVIVRDPASEDSNYNFSSN
jgi:hypothetical protein|tara:strand:- start:394 stop:711 length:318 start_codon:yes stop_codon:yes gene_type:complete